MELEVKSIGKGGECRIGLWGRVKPTQGSITLSYWWRYYGGMDTEETEKEQLRNRKEGFRVWKSI